MAIGANDSIDKFGTEDELTSLPATVVAGAFSASSDVADWTNDDDAPFALFKLKLTAAGLSAPPITGGTISLFARPMNINGAEDAPVPSASYRKMFLQSFLVNPADADQVHILGPVRLPNYKTSQVYEFFIENGMDVDTGTGWQLWITPTTVGPHA